MLVSLEIGVEPAIDRKTPTFVSNYAHGPAFVQLIFALNNFILRLGDICRKSENEIFRNPLLHADSCRRIGVIAAYHRVDLQS